MPDKKRQRVVDKEKYKKKQRIKKNKEIKKKSYEISRNKRNFIRRKITPFYWSIEDTKNKHLLFVIKDTDNMEKILMQKSNLGNGNTLLSLPVVNEKMIQEYLDYANANSNGTEMVNLNINNLCEYFYGVKSEEYNRLDEDNIIYSRNCEIVEKKDSLIEINVRPYDVLTWYRDQMTTVNGVRIFKGNKLKSFFNTKDIYYDLNKTYVYGATIEQLIIYKAIMGKIDKNKAILDHMNLSRTGWSANTSLSTYDLYAEFGYFVELEKIHENEDIENRQLEER